jgi:precorrin-2 dehydrogenase/sirohydrochlorin ferrochelatase
MNHLYPIFLKTENIRILIVGGGNTATEKVSFILKNSPDATIIVVAREISEAIAAVSPAICIRQKEFEENDLDGIQLAIAATNDFELNAKIHRAAKERNVLLNVADTPALCDFYLGSIVTKGELKIAISTNGKSPTVSKRIREFFEAVLPENINDLILHLHAYRNSIKGNLQEKVNKLNELTRAFIDK